MNFARLRLAARSTRSPRESLNMLPLYFSTRRTARVLGIVFVLAAAIGWIAAGYDLGELRTIHGGAELAPAAVLAHDLAGERIAAAQIACAVLLAALFVPWLYQARANVRALGARRLRFGREWTYLAFAIPVLNAYRPYQVVSEVWRGSDPASVDPLGWQRLPTAPLVARVVGRTRGVGDVRAARGALAADRARHRARPDRPRARVRGRPGRRREREPRLLRGGADQRRAGCEMGAVRPRRERCPPLPGLLAH